MASTLARDSARLPERWRKRPRRRRAAPRSENREQSVAHEFQDLAAMGPDRRHLAVEIVIENIDHGLGRQPVRQRGKAAQVRQPDRRMHGFGVAAPNLAAENPLAGAVADIGVEQDRGLRLRRVISMSRASGGISARSRQFNCHR
jgi:hypothetical protein